MDNETLASLLRGRNRAGQPVDATANIIGPAMSALGNTIYGAGRGALTAMAGLPGDINQLITDNLGTLVNAQGLPTTKDIQDFLPLKPTSYEGKLAQKLGEFVPVNPTPIAKGAVAIAKPVGKAMGEQAYRMTEDMLQKQGMMPSIVAYHGTPHNIEGAFDISKVGTGEGAQAYGHGMYFAESPKVAQAYQENLSGKFKPVGSEDLPEKAWDEIGKVMQKHNIAGDIPVGMSEAKHVRMMLNNYGDRLNPNEIKTLEKWAAAPEGNLYKVDIPDKDIPKMLDWDKPLLQQSPNVLKALQSIDDPYIQQAIKTQPKLSKDGEYWEYMGNTYASKSEALEDATPQRIISGYTGLGKNPQEVSQTLGQYGIKGVKYLDQSSRVDGKGTSNFVVFDPKEVKILEKNSKPVSRKDIIEEQVNNLK